MKRADSVNGSIRGRDTDGNPNPVDVYVGQQVKKARLNCGYSQQQVADMMNMTSQQIQKYEKALNRIGCSRLLQLAQVLNVSVNYFFDGYAGDKMPDSLKETGLTTDKKGRFLWEKIRLTEDDVAFLTEYKHIKSPKVAEEIRNLVRALGMLK